MPQKLNNDTVIRISKRITRKQLMDVFEHNIPLNLSHDSESIQIAYTYTWAYLGGACLPIAPSFCSV